MTVSRIQRGPWNSWALIRSPRSEDTEARMGSSTLPISKLAMSKGPARAAGELRGSAVD